MEQGIGVVLFEKMVGGELRQIEEHANYLVVEGREFEAVEGRLNVDTGKLELLLVPMHG